MTDSNCQTITPSSSNIPLTALPRVPSEAASLPSGDSDYFPLSSPWESPRVQKISLSGTPAEATPDHFLSRQDSFAALRSQSTPSSQIDPVSPTSRRRNDNQAHEQDNGNASLPPIDGGKEAWLFLVGSFITEVIACGPAFSYSIFQEYLTSPEVAPTLPGSSSVTVSAIGTLLVCLVYFSAPCFRPLWSRFARWNRWMSFGAACLTSVSLIIASFQTHSIGALLVFMGALPGLGLGLSTLNYIIFLPQWFLKRRSLANGLAFSGAGAGGIFFPFIFSALLNNVGFPWTLRMWAIMNLSLCALGGYWVKPRLPFGAHVSCNSDNIATGSADADDHHRRRRTKWAKFARDSSYLATPLWVVNAALTFTVSVSFFSVSFFLATYCSSLGLSSAAGTGVVAAFNAAALLGEISVGHACDRLAYPRVMFGIALIGSLSTFLLFGLAQSLAGTLFFVLLFGWGAGSWCATWTASAFDIARLRSMQTATVLLSFTFIRGIASLVGPLIAAALYRPEDNLKKAVFGAFGFDHLIGFVGACMVATAVFAGALEVTRKVSFQKVTDAELFTERL